MLETVAKGMVLGLLFLGFLLIGAGMTFITVHDLGLLGNSEDEVATRGVQMVLAGVIFIATSALLGLMSESTKIK